MPPDPHRPSFASSDFTDLNLMKNSFLREKTERSGEQKEADDLHRQRSN